MLEGDPMARMFPTPLPAKAVEDPFRSAERRVYEALAGTLPKATTVFYGAAWLGRRDGGPPVDGEADFIVAHPDHGLLVLEVKGGGIARDGSTGRWLSRDRTGHVHAIKDPLEQAVRTKHALLRKLKDLPGFPAWVDAGHGVILPDSRRSSALLGPEAPREIFAFADDMDRLGERIHEITRFWAGEGSRHGLGSAGVERLVRFLAPTFELPLPAGPALEEDERAILRLTEEQFSVLDLLSRMRRVAVTGGAGTGKTILAREKARRLAAEGFRTLLTCASRPLAETLASQCRDLANLTVRCFGDLCRAFAEAVGLSPPPPQASEDLLARALVEALDRRPEERFDAVVVDEGQDFTEERWDLLRLALKDDDQGILYVFYDDNQRLRPECSRFLAGLPAVTLTKNLRNTRAIYEAANP
ncbi:MAG: NERD domain-containing protein, partial [Deltaproteobacteria bacterium]|nr:NERD domain-containing protein [Deltaproteobacteria bacterium]